jgi:hypothetical protein
MKQYVFGALQQKHQAARRHNLEDPKAYLNYPNRIVWDVATDGSPHRRPAKNDTAIEYSVRKNCLHFEKRRRINCRNDVTLAN